MAALAKDRNTQSRDGNTFQHPVKGARKIYAGALVTLNAGFAQPAVTALSQVAVGRAEYQADNLLGADGAVVVKVTKGTFYFDNFATDLVTRSMIGSDCFIVDDQTVAATNGTNTRSIAGKVVDLDADGVWVKIS